MVQGIGGSANITIDDKLTINNPASPASGPGDKQQVQVLLPEDLQVLISHLLQKTRADEVEGAIRSEWQTIARILDRFFFIVYLLILSITTVIAFVPIISNVRSTDESLDIMRIH